MERKIRLAAGQQKSQEANPPNGDKYSQLRP